MDKNGRKPAHESDINILGEMFSKYYILILNLKAAQSLSGLEFAKVSIAIKAEMTILMRVMKWHFLKMEVTNYPEDKISGMVEELFKMTTSFDLLFQVNHVLKEMFEAAIADLKSR